MKVTPLELLVMDRPVLIRSDDPAVLAAAAAAYPAYPAGRAGDGPLIELDLTLGKTEFGEPTRIEVEGWRLRSVGASLQFWADAQTLTGFCKVPAALVADPGRLASEALDTLLLFLLTRSGRTPVHAAGVMCGQTAVLLVGPSGSGKSTLSVSAMARGLQILSDDTVYIQLQPCFRVWGFPRPVHVFPADAPGFISEMRLRAGKLKAVVPLTPGAAVSMANHAAVVLLQRDGHIRLEPIEAAVAADALAQLEPGFDLLRRESAEAAAALSASGAWRLSLARDPGAAIDLLIAQFGSGVASALAAAR